MGRWLTGRRIAWLTVLFGIAIVVVVAVNSTDVPKQCESGNYAREEACHYLFAARHGIERLNATIASHDNDKLVVAYGTGVIAIFTTILGLFTVRLWSATRELVRGSERTARRQLRAYMLPEKCWFENYGVVDRPRFSVTTKNYGQTPASDVRVWVSWQYRDHFPFELPDDPPGEIGMSSYLLGPQGYPTHFDEAYLDAGRRDLLAKGDAILFILGGITYKDVFGNRQWTKFKFACGKRYGLPESGGELYVYEQGNDAS